MIQIWRRSLRHQRLVRLSRFRAGAWICAAQPSQAEIKQLVRQFDLDYDLLCDALDPFEAPRLEIEEDKVYIFTRFPTKTEDRIETAPLLIVAADQFILTLSPEPLTFLERSLPTQTESYTTQTAKFLLQIFVQINAAYNRQLTEISRRIRQAQVRLERIRNREIVQFVIFEQVLNDFLAALVPTNAILKKLLTGKIIALYAEDKELIEDMFLDNSQLIELSKSNLKMIQNLRDAANTILSNNLNRIMKFFAALSLVLSLPALIGSWWGMNVTLPLAHHPAAFWWLLALSLVLAAGLAYFFWRRDWL